MSEAELDQLRTRLRVTWTELATMIGVTDQTLRRIRKGESRGLPIVRARIRDLQRVYGTMRSGDV